MISSRILLFFITFRSLFECSLFMSYTRRYKDALIQLYQKIFSIRPGKFDLDSNYELGNQILCIYLRSVNFTTEQSSELYSVGPETPKSMKFFWFGPLPVMTSSPLIRLQRPLSPSGDAISKNENRTL